jgi:hypothetical protein
LSKDTVRETLIEKGINQDAIEQFLGTIDSCDLARYAGSVSGLNCISVYASAEQHIKEIESCLRS